MSEQQFLRSYGRIKSRTLRAGAQKLLSEVLPKFQINEFPKLPYKKLWLEIGLGDGGHLAHQAKQNPDVCFIGFEPYINGTVKLLREIDENKMENVRVYPADFRELQIPENSVDRVFVLFPDPWPKRKQNKRRLISETSLEMLHKIMKKGAKLRIATDHPDYAKWIIVHVFRHGKFKWLAETKADWQQPADHIETKYQKKDMAKQNLLFFFEFEKVTG